MAQHSIKIEDGNGKLHSYATENNLSVEETIPIAERVFALDAEHGFVKGPGTVVGYSSIDLDVLK